MLFWRDSREIQRGENRKDRVSATSDSEDGAEWRCSVEQEETIFEGFT